MQNTPFLCLIIKEPERIKSDFLKDYDYEVESDALIVRSLMLTFAEFQFLTFLSAFWKKFSTRMVENSLL